MLEKVFKLKENNTSVKTEIIAGLTTFKIGRASCRERVSDNV